MQIAKNTVVSLDYEMFDAENQLLDKTEEPISYLHGGFDGIFPLVEENLEGKNIGDTIDIMMDADDAFGDPEPDLIRMEDLEVFPAKVEIGMMFEADDPETGDLLLFRVVDIADGKAVIDANHPLAGKSIRFVAKVVDVREATEEEMSHGHVHGDHCHH